MQEEEDRRRDEERKRIEDEELERAKNQAIFENTAVPDYKPPRKPSPEAAAAEPEVDPTKHNDGDNELQQFLEPLLAQAGGNLISLQYDFLNRALSDGTLLVCGAKLWNALHSDSWRHREAAAQAYYDYLESEKIA